MLGWVILLPAVFPEAVETATKMPKATITRSRVLHNISERGLVERFPVELAKFLVHLGQCQTEPWFWMRTRSVIDRPVGKGFAVGS